VNISKQIRVEIERSIEECEKHTTIEGSSDLYDSLVARFTAIDPDFEKGLPKNVKVSSLNSQSDYRPEIKAIKEKLRMMLAQSSNIRFGDKVQAIYDELISLVDLGENIFRAEYIISEGYLEPDRIEGPIYDMWALDVETFSERYLKSHPLYKKIKSNNEEMEKGIPQSVRSVINCLTSISKDHPFFTELDLQQSHSFKLGSNVSANEEIKSNNKVFLVHGHDNEMKQIVARYLEKAKLEAVILHEQPNEGLTIIEKFEKHTDVAFAIVLYSPCDYGRSSKAKADDEKPRARQNVVFEHGYLNGRLGRNRVCALIKEDVEKPSDIDGVLYISMDDRGAWIREVAREMKKAGLDFDLEALIY